MTTLGTTQCPWNNQPIVTLLKQRKKLKKLAMKTSEKRRENQRPVNNRVSTRRETPEVSYKDDLS